jgi:two-component system, NarL family, sensor kinase
MSIYSKRIYTCLIFNLIINFSFSQNKQIDSLLLVLKTSPNDTSKVDLLVTIGRSYLYSHPEEGTRYVQQALDLAKKLNYEYGISLASHSVAGFLIIKTDYINGAKFLNDALTISANKKNKRYKKLYGQSQQSFGVIAYYQDDYSTSVKYYLEAARIYKELDDDGLLLVIYNNLSAVHALLGDKESALTYAEQCYAASKKLDDPFKTSMACVAVASAKIELKKYEGVEKYLAESEKISDSLQNFILIGRTNALIGQLMVDGKNDLKKGIKYFEKALIGLEKSGSQFDIASAHQLLGETHSRDGNYKNAKKELQLAINLSKKIGSQQVEVYSLKSLSELEEKNNNTLEAFKLLKQFNIIKDSLSLNDKQKQVKSLEAKYESQLKELKITELQKEKELQELSIKQKSTINSILASSLLILVLISFLVYRNYKQKQLLQQQQIIQLQNEKLLLASESILKGQEGERSRMAQDLHDGLGGMLSSIKLTLSSMKGNIILTEDNARLFTKAFEQLDSSISEMRRVAHNMMPEALVKLGLQQALQDYCDTINESKQLRVDAQFYGLEKRVESSNEIIIYRIVQELVNNTIKHAHATNLLVQVMKRGEELSITVEDNGTGFDPALVISRNSAGLNNIRSRVDYLKGQIDIQSKPGTGTSVHIDCRVQ